MKKLNKKIKEAEAIYRFTLLERQIARPITMYSQVPRAGGKLTGLKEGMDLSFKEFCGVIIFAAIYWTIAFVIISLII